MKVLIPSAISAAILGALLCPTLAPIAQGLLDGSGIPVIALPDISLAPQWWLSSGPMTCPTGTAASLTLLFLCSALFFATESGGERAEDGGALGSARVKTGAEVVRGSSTWDGKGSPRARGLVYGFSRGRYLFEPGRFSLIDGSTGSGKSRFILIPTIDLLTYGDDSNGAAPHSIVVSDVKNELIELCGPELERRGYRVLLLDTQNPTRGHRYNPIRDLVRLAETGRMQEAEQGADAMAAVIVPDEKGGASHWAESARSLLSALILYVVLDPGCPFGARNLATVNEVLCLGTEGDGADPAAGLKALLRELPSWHPARSRASQFLSSGGNEMRSILSTLKVRMRIFSSSPIAWLVSGDDIEPERILNEKTALFLHVLDEENPYNALLTILLDSLWTSARIAAEANGGSLERPLTIVGDEWGNLPAVRSLPSILSLGRSYGLFWHGAVQNVAQQIRGARRQTKGPGELRGQGRAQTRRGGGPPLLHGTGRKDHAPYARDQHEQGRQRGRREHELQRARRRRHTPMGVDREEPGPRRRDRREGGGERRPDIACGNLSGTARRLHQDPDKGPFRPGLPRPRSCQEARLPANARQEGMVTRRGRDTHLAPGFPRSQRRRHG